MWQLPYGEFDCEVNSVLYLLREYDVPLEPLYRYNFDFYYDEQEDLLRGSVPLEPLLRFVERTFGIAFPKTDIGEVPLHEPAILVADAFYLPYANDYYNKHRLVHYFPAKRSSADSFEVADPIFSYYGPLSADDIRESSGHLNRDTFRLERSPSGGGPSSVATVRPYLAQRREADNYTRAVERMKERLHEALEPGGALYETFLFKKYFANLQNIWKARLRHFESDDTKRIAGELYAAIIASWRKTTKAYMKIGIDRSLGIQETLASLQETSALEKQYLQKYEGAIIG
ncbi:hypothetical protein ACF3MZ_19280 [Paenibacillaceae bacterium WGS1546]|uniref:hypothetical protein n=1 Tax=Cohnella sp. WGS1546 TaxID=3366810 RepID=UPI00372D360B